jgi:hypothetical protein
VLSVGGSITGNIESTLDQDGPDEAIVLVNTPPVLLATDDII